MNGESPNVCMVKKAIKNTRARKDGFPEGSSPRILQMSHRHGVPCLGPLANRTWWKVGAACEDLNKFMFHPGLVRESEPRFFFLRVSFLSLSVGLQ